MTIFGIAPLPTATIEASDPSASADGSDPGEFTILELAETIRTKLGTSVQIVHKPLPKDDPTQRQPDITRAREVLGWAPTIVVAAQFSICIGGTSTVFRSSSNSR